MTIISTDIKKAADLLRNDELVAIPTETVYGLAGNIYSRVAIKNIFKIKQRPFFNPLIVHVGSMEQVNEVAAHFPDKAKQLAEVFWPGSLSLILEKKATVPDLITAGKNTVAVRMPKHKTTLALLKQLDFPLAAPSANPFSKISPTKAAHVEKYFKQAIPMVLDGGPCQNGIESTIVGFQNDDVVVYRLGAISLEDIARVIGKVKLLNADSSAPEAPGMLAKHYSPDTKTYLLDDVSDFVLKHLDKKIGVLAFKTKPALASEIEEIILLSEKGDLAEAAAALYASLHYLDQANLDLILIEKLPETGLGKSINDRLKRAANQ